jgi:hypothetical protein
MAKRTWYAFDCPAASLTCKGTMATTLLSVPEGLAEREIVNSAVPAAGALPLFCSTNPRVTPLREAATASRLVTSYGM